MKFILLAVVLLLSTTARAEAPQCTVPQEVKAPCHGVLLPPEAATEGLKCLKVDKPRLQLKLERLKEITDVQLKSRDKLIAIKDDFIKKQDILIDKSLKLASARSPQFWESPVFWAITGFVIGAASTIAITFAVNDK